MSGSLFLLLLLLAVVVVLITKHSLTSVIRFSHHNTVRTKSPTLARSSTDYFEVEALGNMTVAAGAQVDFEAISGDEGRLTVKISVTDDGSTRNPLTGNVINNGPTNALSSSFATVEVLVRDLNEAPVLEPKPNGITVGSATSIGSVVAILDYRDEDAGDAVTFEEVNTAAGWFNSSGHRQYRLNSSTGEIILAHDPAFSGANSITLKARCRDVAGLESLMVGFAVTVTLDNTPPSFADQNVAIDENATLNSTLIFLSVSDEQVAESCNPASLTRPSDGKICTAITEASNGADWRKACVADNVCEVAATSGECTCRRQRLVFALERVSPLFSELKDKPGNSLSDNPFTVTTAGEVILNSAIDFESIQSYTLTIVVDDTGTGNVYTASQLNSGDFHPSGYIGQMSTVASLTIVVRDVQEAPYFTASSFTLEVKENQPLEYVLPSQIIVYDPDPSDQADDKVKVFVAPHTDTPGSKNHGHSVFEFTPGPNGQKGSGDWNEAFEQFSTQLRVKAPIDFESSNEYVIDALAQDVDDLLTSPKSTPIIIRVLDVNEPPVCEWIALPSQNPVREDAKPGTRIGRVSCFDPDANDESLQFSLISGFADELTLESLQLDKKAVDVLVGPRGLDFETTSSFAIVVNAMDSGLLNGTVSFTISVTDVDDVKIADMRIFNSKTSQWAESLRTQGGDVIVITGESFGVIGGTPEVSVRYGRAESAFSFVTLPCSVGDGNRQLNCTTRPGGFGTDLVLNVTISGASTGRSSSGVSTLRYADPEILSMTTAENASLSTSGANFRNIIIIGRNLGSQTGMVFFGEYGIYNGAGYCAKDCIVAKIDAKKGTEEVTCRSSPGVGSGHRLRLRLLQDGRPRHSYWESAPSDDTLDYAPPLIARVTPQTDTGFLSTIGGEEIVIEGTSLGAVNPPAMAHCDGSLVSDAPPSLPPTFRYGPTSNNKLYKYEAKNCRVEVADTRIRCAASDPGVGARLRARITTGFAEHLVQGVARTAAISYGVPTISRVLGPGALASSTSGGDTIEVWGSNFGPPSTDSKNSVRVWYNSEAGPNIFARACVVQSHDAITCTSGPGVGFNLTYYVEVEQQVSVAGANKVTGSKADARVPRHNGGAYAAPSVETVTTVSGDSVYDADTRGNETVLLRGNQFGPADAWNSISATFGLPPNAPGAALQQFDAVDCRVTLKDKEILCRTSRGAGSKHQWKVQVGGLWSVLAETSFGKPAVLSVAMLGNTDDKAALNVRGGQTVILKGNNFGPPEKSSSYIESVTYGRTGTEYDCTSSLVAISHQELRCDTLPGTGAKLTFRVTVLGQASDATNHRQSEVSYAPPSITSVWTSTNASAGARASTSGDALMYVRASNAGVGVPNGNTLSVLWGTRERALNLDRTLMRRDGDSDVIVFRIPELIGESGTRSAHIPIRLRVAETDGSLQTSAESYEWDYLPPVLSEVHMTSGATPLQFKLTLLGENFGNPGKEPVGAVFLHAGDGCSGGATPPCEMSTVANSATSHIVSWSHREIVLAYSGTFGTLSIRTSKVTDPASAHQDSGRKSFNTTSPTIRYMSSDQGLNMAPFATTGFVAAGDARNPTSVDNGILTIGCSFCYAVGLSVRIGEFRGSDDPLGLNPQADHACRNVQVEYPVERNGISDMTELTCKVPPGMGDNVSVVVDRSGSRSLPSMRLSYRPPRVKSVSNNSFPTKGSVIVIDGSDFGDPGAAVCYFGETSMKTTAIGSGRDKLHAVVPPGYAAAARDIWCRVGGQSSCRASLAHDNTQLRTKTQQSECPTANYLAPVISRLALPDEAERSTEGGFSITIDGENFFPANHDDDDDDDDESDASVVNVTIAGTPCDITNASFSKIICTVQEAVGESLDLVVTVADQDSTAASKSSLSGSSGTPPPTAKPSAITGGGGSGIQLVELSYSKPEVYSVSPQIIPTTALHNNGSRIRIELIGRNFGTESLSKSFRIYVGATAGKNIIVYERGDAAILVHDHRRIVFLAPAGQGSQLQIVVEVGPTLFKAQNSTNKAATLSYDKPRIEIHTATVTGPTDGCAGFNGWESILAWAARKQQASAADVLRDPSVFRRRCLTPYTISLRGSNFGRDLSSVRITVEPLNASQFSKDESFAVYPPDQRSHSCPFLAHNHNQMTLCAPVGYGAGRRLVVVVGGQVANYIPYAFDKPLVTRVESTPYDGARASRIVIHGLNFGGKSSAAAVTIDGKICSSATWAKEHVSDGFPFISCEAPVDVVGSKNITVSVAEQTVAPVPILVDVNTAVIRSECLPGETFGNGSQELTYARVGELCARCPRGAICRGVYAPPVAQEGYYVVTLDVSKDDGTTTENDAMARRAKEDYARASSQDPLTGVSRCPPERLLDADLNAALRVQFPLAVKNRWDVCLEARACLPGEACTGDNQCAEPYRYQQQRCEDKTAGVAPVQCKSSLQCQLRSFGSNCAAAIDAACHVGMGCPREWEKGSYECLKRCLRNASSLSMLTGAGCPGGAALANIHAGRSPCRSENPEDCASCELPNNWTAQIHAGQIAAHALDLAGQCRCQASERCALCSAGTHYRIEGKCELCPKNVELVIVGFVLGIFFLSIGGYILDKRNFNMAFISIGVDYFQVLALFSSVDVAWPPLILYLYRVMGIFNFNIDGEFFVLFLSPPAF